jgi:hypothetical protein
VLGDYVSAFFVRLVDYLFNLGVYLGAHLFEYSLPSTPAAKERAAALALERHGAHLVAHAVAVTMSRANAVKHLQVVAGARGDVAKDLFSAT